MFYLPSNTVRAIAKCAAPAKDARALLTRVHVKDDCMQATDSFVHVIVHATMTTGSMVTGALFDAATLAKVKAGKTCVMRNDAIDVIDVTPAKASWETIEAAPVLQTIEASYMGAEHRYPKCDNLYAPDGQNVPGEVRINASYLNKVLAVAGTVSEGADVETFEQNKPATVNAISEVATMRGLVMPIHK